MSVEINDYGGAPFATHNQPCAVCHTLPAVLIMNSGIFQPCHRCRSDGWGLHRKEDGFWKRLWTWLTYRSPDCGCGCRG